MQALAIDVGGTKLAAAVIDDTGAILGRHRVATPASPDAEAVFAAVCAAADGALAASGAMGLAGIGVATAGPLDLRVGTVSPVNIGAWRGFSLRDRLGARYGGPVRMFGDAVAVTVAEHWLGAAQGLANVLGMVVSTGVGGGLILGGRVVPGSGGNAGHIGHVAIDPDGPRCACGGVGCLEVLASGTSIGRWAAERTADRAVPLDTAAAVAAAARDGDAVALEALRRAAEAIGMAVAGAVTLLDLDRVVIGGGVSQAFDLLSEPLAAAYCRYAALDYAAAPRVVPARLGGDAGILGAAAVVLRPDYWPFAD